jgi:5-methylcytosine-specific restriction endonuclease McrA
MTWIGTKTNGCLHLAQFDVDEILAQRRPTWDDQKQVFFAGRRLKVRLNSIRYHVFAQSRTCACCNRKGTMMLLDVHHCRTGLMYSRAHFNLYAVEDSKLILMTVDHIIPRSRGGTDDLDNLQTLCTKCNSIKGNRDFTLDKLRETVFGKKLVAA